MNIPSAYFLSSATIHSREQEENYWKGNNLQLIDNWRKSILYYNDNQVVHQGLKECKESILTFNRLTSNPLLLS